MDSESGAERGGGDALEEGSAGEGVHGFIQDYIGGRKGVEGGRYEGAMVER